MLYRLRITGVDYNEQLEDLLFSIGALSISLEKRGTEKILFIISEKPDKIQEALGESVGSVEEIIDSDWKNSWVDAFRGDEISEDIYVLPQNAPKPEKKYKYLIVIDPRDSFGDGNHPTTRLCLKFLSEIIPAAISDDFTMLDAGCGSGILSVFSSMAGIKNIDMFDIEDDAVLMSEKNLEINGISGIYPFKADATEFTSDKKYDLIATNMNSSILERSLSGLGKVLKPGGRMIISGVSEQWAIEMSSFLEKSGFSILRHEIFNGWNAFIVKIF